MNTSDLPQRPVQHELQTASHRAFESSLPPSWAATEKSGSDDYGVDYDVEIFRDGRTTGERFGAQVKATSSVAGAPSVRIKWRTRRYWQSLSEPVLVVLWDKATGTLWWEWSHRFDAYGLSQTSVYFTFSFPTDQVWDMHATSSLIEREVRAWNAWTRGQVRLPIDIILTRRASGGGLPSARHLGLLRTRLGDVSDVFRVVGELRGAVGMDLTMGPHDTSVSLLGGVSATLHHSGLDWTDSALTRTFVNDVVALLGARLAQERMDAPAATIIAAIWRDASIILQPNFAWNAVRLLLEANRIDDAIGVLGRVTQHHQDIEASTAAAAAFLVGTTTLATEHREQAVRTLRAWADASSRRDDRPQAGRLTYIAARVVGAEDPQQSAQLLQEAVELDPAHEARDYWHRDVGGMYFLAGDFAAAAEHYRDAVTLGSTEAEPLLADALLFSGRYRQALELLDQVVSRGAWEPEWRLKHTALSFLITKLDIKEQSRLVEDAAALARDPEADHATLLEALSKDMLCGEALFRLGLDAREPDQRLQWFIASAAAEPHAPAAWINALYEADVTDSPESYEDVLLCARRFGGESLIQFALELDDTGNLAAELQRLFDSALMPLPRLADIRFVAPHREDFVLYAPEDSGGVGFIVPLDQ